MTRRRSTFETAVPGSVTATIRLAWPILMGSATVAVCEFTNRVFLGKHSESALAAILPSSMVACTCLSVLLCIVSYSATLVAQCHGAKDGRGVVTAFAQGVWLTLFSIPILALASLIGLWIIGLFGHPSATQANERTYFICFMTSGPFMLLSAVLGGYFSGQGQTRPQGLSTAIGCIVNIALDYVLILVLGLGILGAGLATITASATTFLLLLIHARRDPLLARSRWTDFRFSPAVSRQVMRFGLPLGLSAVVGAGTFTWFTLTLGCISIAALAAGNACFAIHSLIYNVVLSIESAVHINAGNFAGAGSREGIQRSLRSGLILAISAVCGFYLIVLPFSTRLLSCFSSSASNDSLVEIGRVFLLICFVRAVFEAALHVYQGGLRGIGKTRSVLWAHVVGNIFIWCPLFMLAAAIKSPLLGWASMIAAMGIHAFVLMLAFRRLRSKPNGTFVPFVRTPAIW